MVKTKTLADEAAESYNSDKDEKRAVSTKTARDIVDHAFRSLSRKVRNGDINASEALRLIERADTN